MTKRKLTDKEFNEIYNRYKRGDTIKSISLDFCKSFELVESYINLNIIIYESRRHS